MSGVIPSLFIPDAQIIRTYPRYYGPSDSESEGGDAQFEPESDDEGQQSIMTRLEQNREYMDQQMTQSAAWQLDPRDWQTPDGTNVVLIRKPTASNLSHRLLNPFIYRNIRNVGTLNELAVLLKTPDGWDDRYNEVIADGDIIMDMNDFRNLPHDTAESNVQARFIGLVSAVATRLRVRIGPESETKIIVGGILARYEYDVRSKTDPHFLNASGQNLIASEAKTHITFAPGDMWYHASRGVQVLSALYAFNCPTFLFTQRQWKVFVENTERNAIFTFPYNDNPEYNPHVNSSLVQPMGTTFLKVIVICLLSQRGSLVESAESIKIEESSQVTETPEKVIIKGRYFETPKQATRRSTRIQGRPKPSYVSGYDDKGQPVYTLVRVIPQDVVDRIEHEIALQDSKEYQKQQSEMTLVE